MRHIHHRPRRPQCVTCSILRERAPNSPSNIFIPWARCSYSMTLKDELREFLGEAEGRRVVIVGIGSPIRGDDAVGLLVVDHLEERPREDVLVLKAETVPESFTGAIREFRPTHVLMVDAAHFEGRPGEARMIPTQAIGGSTVSTHSLPLTVFSNFIERTMSSNVALLGIQVKDITFGTEITPEVNRASREIAEAISEVLEN